MTGNQIGAAVVGSDMRRLIIPVLLVLGLLVACGDDTDDDAAVGDGGAVPEEGADAPASDDDASDDDASGTGTLVIGIEEVEGVFIEGFEAGFRIETPDGGVVDSFLWTDYVASLDSGDLEAFYESTYEVEVPAGEVRILAEVNVGIGPPPSVPDVDGDLPCELTVEVPDGERVEVEANFSGESDCVRLVEGEDDEG